MASKRSFPLKGYILPLSPKGKAAVIDPPPWHYGGDVMHLVFKANEKKMRALLPSALEPGPNPGEGVVWFVEWVSASDAHPDLASVNPERSIYHECIVMVGCQFKGVPGYYVPYIWVDNDFTLMRGFIQGFPKKLGRVHITKLHEYMPVAGGKKAGAKIKGICASHEERIVEGSLTLKKQVPPQKVPPFKFYLMRHFPDYEDAERPLVHDILISNVTNAKIGDAWEGDADIRFFPSDFEELTDLGPIKPIKGFFFQVGMTIMGGTVIHRYR